MPHPDPRVEAELRRILSLRQAVGARERTLRSTHRSLRGTSVPEVRAAYANEIRGVEDEIVGLHDEIAKRIAALSDTDLAYL
jgi:hypothetical protein